MLSLNLLGIYILCYLALDQHVKEVVVRLSVGHQVVEDGTVAILMKSEAGQVSS